MHIPRKVWLPRNRSSMALGLSNFGLMFWKFFDLSIAFAPSCGWRSNVGFSDASYVVATDFSVLHGTFSFCQHPSVATFERFECGLFASRAGSLQLMSTESSRWSLKTNVLCEVNKHRGFVVVATLRRCACHLLMSWRLAIDSSKCKNAWEMVARIRWLIHYCRKFEINWVHFSRVDDPLVRMSAGLLGGVDIFGWDSRVHTNLAKLPVQVDAMSQGNMSHGWAPAFDDHLDHSIVVFRNEKRCSLSGDVNVWRNKINAVRQNPSTLWTTSFFRPWFVVHGIAPSWRL